MPKQFYTERDIEDMVRNGILSLEINDNVVLTNNAYEKANALGMQLLRDKPEVPPNAPIRPYITKMQSQQAARPAPKGEPLTPAPVQAQSNGAKALPSAQPVESELRQRIHHAVIARLGDQVDSNLLDIILTRVFQSTGIK